MEDKRAWIDPGYRVSWIKLVNYEPDDLVRVLKAIPEGYEITMDPAGFQRSKRGPSWSDIFNSHGIFPSPERKEE